MDDVRQVRGGTVTAYRYVLQEGLIGNPLFEAEVSKKQNYGIDIGLFNSLTLSLDYFKERMDNMVVQAVARIPAYQGVPLGNYPKTNVGKFENHGVDLSLGFTKQINKDWRVFAYGTFTWADNKVIDVAEAIKDEGYVYRHRTEGFPVGTQFGYVTDGYYNTQEELDAAPEHSFGTPRLGALKYVDLNEDGRITEADQVPLNKGWMPRYSTPSRPASHTGHGISACCSKDRASATRSRAASASTRTIIRASTAPATGTHGHGNGWPTASRSRGLPSR